MIHLLNSNCGNSKFLNRSGNLSKSGSNPTHKSEFISVALLLYLSIIIYFLEIFFRAQILCSWEYFFCKAGSLLYCNFQLQVLPALGGVHRRVRSSLPSATC